MSCYDWSPPVEIGHGNSSEIGHEDPSKIETEGKKEKKKKMKFICRTRGEKIRL